LLFSVVIIIIALSVRVMNALERRCIMPYKISTSGDGTYIRIHRWRVVVYEELKKSLEEVINLANERNIRHVLIDGWEIEAYPSSQQIFHYGETISKLFSSTRLWFAAIFGEKSRDDMRFIETVIHNRTRNARLFADEESALSWLKSMK